MIGWVARYWPQLEGVSFVQQVNWPADCASTACEPVKFLETREPAPAWTTALSRSRCHHTPRAGGPLLDAEQPCLGAQPGYDFILSQSDFGVVGSAQGRRGRGFTWAADGAGQRQPPYLAGQSCVQRANPPASLSGRRASPGAQLAAARRPRRHAETGDVLDRGTPSKLQPLPFSLKRLRTNQSVGPTGLLMVHGDPAGCQTSQTARVAVDDDSTSFGLVDIAAPQPGTKLMTVRTRPASPARPEAGCHATKTRELPREAAQPDQARQGPEMDAASDAHGGGAGDSRVARTPISAHGIKPRAPSGNIPRQLGPNRETHQQGRERHGNPLCCRAAHDIDSRDSLCSPSRRLHESTKARLTHRGVDGPPDIPACLSRGTGRGGRRSKGHRSKDRPDMDTLSKKILKLCCLKSARDGISFWKISSLGTGGRRGDVRRGAYRRNMSPVPGFDLTELELNHSRPRPMDIPKRGLSA